MADGNTESVNLFIRVNPIEFTNSKYNSILHARTTSITFASPIRFVFHFYFWSFGTRRHLFCIRCEQWHDDELEEWQQQKMIAFLGKFSILCKLNCGK